MSTAIGLVEAGVGVAILPESAFTADLARRVQVVAIREPVLRARRGDPDARRPVALAGRRAAGRDAAERGARRSDRYEDDAEADVVGAALGLVAQAERGAAGRRDRSRRRRGGRASRCRRGSASPLTLEDRDRRRRAVRVIPVAAPLEDVAVHVVQTPGIGRIGCRPASCGRADGPSAAVVAARR